MYPPISEPFKADMTRREAINTYINLPHPLPLQAQVEILRTLDGILSFQMTHVVRIFAVNGRKIVSGTNPFAIRFTTTRNLQDTSDTASVLPAIHVQY